MRLSPTCDTTITSEDNSTTTPVEPEWDVLILCRNSLSKRKKLLEIKGAVAGPKGGLTEQSCKTQLMLSRQKPDTSRPLGPCPSNTPNNETLSFNLLLLPPPLLLPSCVKFSINKKLSWFFQPGLEGLRPGAETAPQACPC